MKAMRDGHGAVYQVHTRCFEMLWDQNALWLLKMIQNAMLQNLENQKISCKPRDSMGQVACKVSPPTTSIAKHRPKLIFKLKFNLMVSGYFHHLRARSTLTRPLLSLESPLAFVHIEISFMSKFWPMMCRKKILGSKSKILTPRT